MVLENAALASDEVLPGEGGSMMKKSICCRGLVVARRECRLEHRPFAEAGAIGRGGYREAAVGRR